MNWYEKLDQFGQSLLSDLGHSYLPSDHNPVTRALKSPDFVERYGDLKGFNRTALSKAATICQAAVFDAEGGPEGDRKPKALRRHWYSWYKGEFAQPLSEQLGEDLQSERWGLNWAGRLSQTYAWFVDSANVTYRDLWVGDASRMMERNHETLFAGCHIIVAVEKDSLFSDFVSAAKALGARTVYSGKGKSSKAAIEKVLREHFDWQGNDSRMQSEALIVLHISDHDFDGEAVIGPTFGEQSRRYCDNVLEARVGIRPETVVDLGHDPQDKWYQIKVSNRGYESWAAEKALFLNDWGRVCVGRVDYEKDLHTAHGFEVEALKTRDYYGLLVDALLTVLPFDYIVSRLRDECQADAWQAVDQVRDDILAENESYQKLLAEFDRLEEIKERFENQIGHKLISLGEPHIEDWRNDDDDPRPEDYRGYVERANGWATPWRPFDRADRTASLVEWLRENGEDAIEDFENEKLDW